MFKPVDNKVSFPNLEENVLSFWEEHHTFEKSIEERSDSEGYVFYDGPPFATGLPHYGHLLAGTIKDVIPRYQTMRGHQVQRTFGWDCHGLPIEALAQDALNVSGAPAIKELGIDIFNEKCRSMVSTYVNEWKKTVTRMGRWVDFDHGYKTMDSDFMETIWWVFKQLWDKDRVYRAHRIMPYSWKLSTPLSNFEANRNYQDVQDPAITVRVKIKTLPIDLPSDADSYILLWTTTPWTLPENLAVCAGSEIDYVAVKDTDSGDIYILAEERLSAYYKNEEAYEILKTLKGSELKGGTYEPLFPYFADQPNSFVVLNDAFVTTSDGTGIVHLAPAYGEDDYRVCRDADIDLVDPLDESAVFGKQVADFEGLYCKEADKKIIRWLKDEGKLVHQSTIVHSYPFCERTDTPLIYRAIEAWYVKVEDMQQDLLKSNEPVNWMPDYVGEKRFANWLGDAKDWNISRNRFWGSCIPVWINVDDPDDSICVGSVSELEELSGEKVEDLHKHFVDKIIIEKDGKTYKRTPEVLDCWFESGSMPYAQHHYPFENKEYVEAHFPADFIAEGLDQTRGWFYTLTVLATALFGKPAFKNVVVNGLVLAEDGKKMSKRLKNYPDPNHIMNDYGADALRLCLLSSPVVRAEDLKFSENGVREAMRSIIIPIWNSYSFLVTYANVDNWQPKGEAAPPTDPSNVLDQWVLSRLQGTVDDIRTSMDEYDLQRSAGRFIGFIEDLTNWYIRRSRRRFWKSSNDTDKNEAYATLHYVLVTFTKIAAPFIPFITEEIYRNLRTDSMPESVHLCNYPAVDNKYRNILQEEQMSATMTAVSLGRYLRTQSELRVRQPLKKAVVVSADAQLRESLQETIPVIAEELNVKTVEIREDEEALVELSAKANFKALGPKLGKQMRSAAAAIQELSSAQITAMRKGGQVSINLDNDEHIDICMDDILVQRTEKGGMTVANEGKITVALETTLDDELINEGWAREVVSRIQNTRKEMDLEVSDRISIICDLPDEAANAIAAHKDYICAETLADRLEFADLAPLAPVCLNGEECRIKIKKVC